MLRAISWGNFLTGVGVLSACYYAVLAATVYRAEIIKFFNRLAKGSQTKAGADGTDGTSHFREYRTLIHEIDGILEAEGKATTKEQLLPLLKQQLSQSTLLQSAAIKDTVFEYVIRHASEVCGVNITASDLH